MRAYAIPEAAERMRDDIVRVLAKLEALDTINEKAEDIHRDHEARLRMLEAFKWKLGGACLALGGIAGGAASLIALAAHH
jgi:hypothetical protein